MAFIGEDRLLVAEDSDLEGITPKLVLFDMSCQGEPFARAREVTFLCDPRFQGARVGVRAEAAGHSDFSQVIGQDVPFYPDPSQRVLVLTFFPRGSAHGPVLGICVVHTEAILRLAREKGEGVIEWDAWGRYTVAPEKDDVTDTEKLLYLVSGSRFVTVKADATGKRAKVKLYDLSHWSRQQPDVGQDERRGLDKKVQIRLIEGDLDLPQNIWNICHASMLQDSLVFFSVGSSEFFF